MRKEDDRIIGFMLVLIICALAVLVTAAREQPVQVPAAVLEASYGEEPKPEGHGR